MPVQLSNVVAPHPVRPERSEGFDCQTLRLRLSANGVEANLFRISEPVSKTTSPSQLEKQASIPFALSAAKGLTVKRFGNASARTVSG